MNLFRTLAIFAACVLTLGVAYAAVTEEQEARDEKKRLIGSPETWGAEIAALQDKLRALQSKVNDLENRKMGTVTAPFTVVDGRGRPRFRVNVNGELATMTLFDAAGQPKLVNVGKGEGAQVLMFGPSGNPLATIASTEKGAGITLSQDDGSQSAELVSDEGLMLSKGERQLVTLKADEAYSALVLEQDNGATWVDISSRDGIALRGKDGKQLIQMWTDGKESEFDVYSATSGVSVAQLKAVDGGTGKLTLTDNAGSEMVLAGVTNSGVGFVKLGPGGNGAAQSMAGMGRPASALIGLKGGK